MNTGAGTDSGEERENSTWGRRRIQAERRFLGYDVAELTVAKYMRRIPSGPSPTWRAFLHAHLRETVAVDFFLVPTLTFRLLCVFVILRHDRRELLHVNVTDRPTAPWTARQIIDAFPDETAPKYLFRHGPGPAIAVTLARRYGSDRGAAAARPAPSGG